MNPTTIEPWILTILPLTYISWICFLCVGIPDESVFRRQWLTVREWVIVHEQIRQLWSNPRQLWSYIGSIIISSAIIACLAIFFITPVLLLIISLAVSNAPPLNKAIKTICFLQIMSIEYCTSVWPFLGLLCNRTHSTVAILGYIIHLVLALYGLSRNLDGPWVSALFLHLTALVVHSLLSRKLWAKSSMQQKSFFVFWFVSFAISFLLASALLVFGIIQHKAMLEFSWAILWVTCILGLVFRKLLLVVRRSGTAAVQAHLSRYQQHGKSECNAV
ncbi:hypothetical protein F4678DRAFT_416836 [Xylaria arbuscula]|nr:hypothetical protein F4678DRAFT_416836 [Xylaria arbuscula]